VPSFDVGEAPRRSTSSLGSNVTIRAFLTSRFRKLMFSVEGRHHVAFAVGNSYAGWDVRGSPFDGSPRAVRLSIRRLAGSNSRWLGGVGIRPHRTSLHSWSQVSSVSEALNV